MNEHYQTLGVSNTATQDEIKAAYKELAKKNHPDNGGDPNKMQNINAAWDALKTPEKRQQYDREQTMGNAGFHPFSGGTSENADINSIFEEIRRARGGQPFTSTHFGHGFQQVRRNPNTDVQYGIDLKQAYNGYSITVKVRLQTGKEKEFKLDLPAGIEHGSRLLFSGQGTQPNPNIPAGDVIFHIMVQNDQPEGFHRQGADLYGKVVVSSLDAITGCTVDFKNLNDKTIRVNIPAGSQPGSLLKCANYGFPVQPGIRGNLFITVEVNTPKGLSAKQLALVEELKNKLKST